MNNVFPLPVRSPRRPESTGSVASATPPYAAVDAGPVQSSNVPGLFLVSRADEPRADDPPASAATSGAGRASGSRPAPNLPDEDEPSMSVLRRALAKALIDGDHERAEMFRAVIFGRVAAAQALPSSPIPDDAA